MTTPLISVLMPVYNAERYVAEAVESVLGQTFADFEFLIVDDGSTDGSRAILERYAARDPRIRLVSRSNTGYVVALNEMLAEARGEFVARMDADDVCLPERFERQVEFLQADAGYVAVGSPTMLIDADGAPLCPLYGPTEHAEIDDALLRGVGSIICHPTLLARRAAMVEVGGYRQEYYPAEDADLLLRLAERGRLANLSDALFKYRRHPQAVGYQHHVRQREALWWAAVAATERRGGITPPPYESFGGPLSVVTQLRTWAWWALSAGNVTTARKHAWRAMCLAPWSPASWKVAYCAYRGW